MLRIGNKPIDYESYVASYLDEVFSKIRIVDNSLDKEEIRDLVADYFVQKFYREENLQYDYDFIDLFCGAGGLSVGLEHEGFRPIAAVDNNKAAITTYKFNRPWLGNENVHEEDIRELLNPDIFPHVPLIVGGPPCQGFSIVNKHKKDHDERNELYRFYVHSVDIARPQVFLMENVEGILKLYDIIKNDFEHIGYITCNPIVLNTKDFGFPQSRKRAFIIGFQEENADIAAELYDSFNETINGCKLGRQYSLWDAIGDLPSLDAKTAKNSTCYESAAWGYTCAGLMRSDTEYVRFINDRLPLLIPLLNHRSKYNNERDIQIYRLLNQGEKSDAESIQDINPYKSRSDIFRDKFHKLVADDPCKAMTAHMYYDCNMYIHPYQARGLTPREAARIQGFPDDYFFFGSPNEWYRQIGNAVSPLMARVLGRGLKVILDRINGYEGNH